MSLVNFAWVIDGVLARSGRPTPVDYPWIDATFKEVISFEGEAEDWKEADGFAVPLLSLPIGFTEIYFTGVSQKCLNEDLGAIQQAPRPVLVHCQHGEDRTGLVVAAYRVRMCGWSKTDAMAEAVRFGYHRWPLNIGLTKTWKAFQP